MMSNAKLALIAIACLFGAVASASNYKITSHDTDYTIAHKFHISVAELHRDNPHVHWNRLHPGDYVDIPKNGHRSHEDSDSHHSSSKASHKSSSKGNEYYRPTNHDNDYSIAKKFGLSVKELHELNADINWRKIGPSVKVRVSSGGSSSSSRSHVIHTKRAVIDGDNVNLREKPTTHSDSITQVDAGEVALILKRNGDWYELKFPKGTVAWVRGDFLTPKRGEKESNETSSHHREGRESYIAEKRSRKSYNVGDYVNAPNEKISSLIATAFGYRGTPYSWGGTSRSGGFDCSGFTRAVYSKNGVDLPRTSREQSEVGEKISMDHLHKGDLVFFDTEGDGVSHVGIYIGDNKFIHASSGGGRVMVSSLNEPYYYNRFVCGRRIIKKK